MIIIDMGSGETCRNDIAYAKRMIDELYETGLRAPIDVVIKWQLFADIPGLDPLDFNVFCKARDYAAKLGYETTASVFDVESLHKLRQTKPPFIKIAARPKVYRLIDLMPGERVIVSVQSYKEYRDMVGRDNVEEVLCCVAKYPATSALYENMFSGLLHYGLSDHTVDWYLYDKFRPRYYECHFCLDDSTGPDAAAFARRPEQMKRLVTK